MDFDRWLQRFVTAVEKVIFRNALTLVSIIYCPGYADERQLAPVE